MPRISLPSILVAAAIAAVAIVSQSSCIIDDCEDGICVPETSTGAAGGNPGAGGTAGAGATAAVGGTGGAGEGGEGGSQGGSGGN